jgi:exoribonuclease R
MNDRAESDGTIIMLQQELQGANEAISELKLALRMALLEKTEPSASDAQPDKRSLGDQDRHFSDSAHGNDNTPLFFAIEKQNELNTARDEINRLANLLGDAESEKQEAFDAMEEMRQKMEEANARLLRYEKLGMKSARPPHSSSGYTAFRGTGHSTLYADGHNGERMVSRENDSAVNLEYLKNVMLSYLKAKTLADRRKLVPVIATVLCLTPEEQSQAVLSVEESAGLVGVASSFWENLESKAHNLM